MLYCGRSIRKRNGGSGNEFVKPGIQTCNWNSRKFGYRSIQLIPIGREDPHAHLGSCLGRTPVPSDEFTGVGELPQKAAKSPEGDDEVHGSLLLDAQ